MKTEGTFKYFYNNESKTKEEIEQLIDYDTTASVDGFCVNYFSPKKAKEAVIEGFKRDIIQDLLKEVDEHQKQNSGILEGFEFPFDTCVNKTNWLQYSYSNAIEPVGDTQYGKQLCEKFKSQEEQKIIEDWNKKEKGQNNQGCGYSKLKSNPDVLRYRMTKKEASKTEGNIMKDKFAEGGTKAGQKYNKLKAPLDILQTRQFPKALQLLALATAYGNHKYKNTDSDFLNFKRVEGGSQTYLDASSRHSTDRNSLDDESGLHHFIHAVWNGIAALELWAEENEINIEEYSKKYLKNLVVSK